MRKPSFPSTLLLLLLPGGVAAAGAAEPCTARGGPLATPLVELYTSEGCSSCLPADRWLSAQIAGRVANFLAFHVDYWDDIGWPDRFASPRYSQRQRERVGAAGQSTVYTPQVMVGSVVQASWHDGHAWQETLEEARGPAGAALSLRMRPAGDGWKASVGAAPVDAQAAGAQLWLARYIDNQSSAVHAGENRGATLHHDRVVRQLSGPWALPAAGALSEQVDLPAEAGAWGVTAFVQDARGKVLQSVSLAADACGKPPPNGTDGMK